MRVPLPVSDCLIDWGKWNNATEVYVDTHNKIASIIVPKSGSTYTSSLCDNNAITRFVGIDHKDHDVYRANLLGSMDIQTRINLIANHLSDYQFFQIIREPISRFVSGLAQAVSMYYQKQLRLDSYTDSELREFLDRVPLTVYMERSYQGPEEYSDLCRNISGNDHLMTQTWFINQLPTHPDDVVWFTLDDAFSDNFYDWHQTSNNFKHFGNRRFHEKHNGHDELDYKQEGDDNFLKFFEVRRRMYNVITEYIKSPQVISDLENIYQSDRELWENTKKIAYKAKVL